MGSGRWMERGNRSRSGSPSSRALSCLLKLYYICIFPVRLFQRIQPYSRAPPPMSFSRSKGRWMTFSRSGFISVRRTLFVHPVAGRCRERMCVIPHMCYSMCARILISVFGDWRIHDIAQCTVAMCSALPHTHSRARSQRG